MTDVRSIVRRLPWTPIPWAIVGALLVNGFVSGVGCGKLFRSDDPRGAIVSALAHDGYSASLDDVHLFRRPATFRTTEGIVRAWKQGEPADLFRFFGRITSDGAVVGELSLYNITSTPADEGPFKVRNQVVAFPVRSQDGVVGIRVIDLRGDASVDDQWSAMARLQDSVTNLQQTGAMAGMRSEFWAVDPPLEDVEIQINADDFVEVRSASSVAWLPAVGGRAIGDAFGIDYRESVKGQPGNLVTWAVDRVRSTTWFGDDRMQVLKTIAFSGLDVFRRMETSVLGDSSEQEIANDLGGIVSRNPPTTFTDPETGWPPPPIEPFFKKPIENEGRWIPLENDPFIRRNPGVPPAFLTSFVRTDPARSYTRIYVTLWDPRQIQLHMMAGSVEPKGASGEAGPGMIPRQPEVMKRLVAGLNGGFQAMHGEWGMMGEGVIYLPPKPYSATVVAMRDGNTGFGTWPNDASIPPEIHSYRQNLTPLVMDGVINPYKRGWWGGTPPEWEDRVHTTRTGICLTKEGFIAFLYGNEIDMMPLAQAMIQTRCQYGLHMDMNPGHTGLEFYKVGPSGTLPELGRALDRKWEAANKVPHMEGWSFQARRMTRFMGLMNFPRYIQREGRDFFYLTLRPVLPGADIDLGDKTVPDSEPGSETSSGLRGQIKWRTTGLPQHGFPYAIATAQIEPDGSRPDTKVLIVKIDPRMVRVSAGTDVSSDEKVVLSISNANPVSNQLTLWMGAHAGSVSSAPMEGGVAVVSGVSLGSPQAGGAVAALGIDDEDGMLVYVEVQQGRRADQDSKMLSSLMDKLGCSSPMLLLKPLLPSFGQRAGAGAGVEREVQFVRVEGPGAKRVFEDTPVVHPDEWGPLQARRIRYFRKPKSASDE
ncbi:MAG: hypothetical protein FWD57_04810 [Polyangiaceae bacterium]|nr:hypothetical protein [Polyangiaceae bacterium]